MSMKFVASAIISFLVMGFSPILCQTLPDVARQHGGSATTIINVDAPVARLPDLMSTSDLVVHARVVNVKARLSANQSDVVTQYTLAPIQAFKQRQATAVATPGAISQIVVTRSGGDLLTADGLHLSTSVDVFPESECYTLGEEVVAFLTYRADISAYSFTGGEFGAYRIRAGIVTPMIRRVVARRHDQPITSAVFFQGLQRLR
jgi:hypothetical protein